jgi:MoaA/NifB/PqqE/SkfB family radical SAM enzyme
MPGGGCAVLKMMLKTIACFGLRNALVRFFWGLKTTILRRSKRFFQIEIHIAEHCNLNCKGCGHFSPLAEKIFLEPEAFERDCARLAKITGKLVTIKLIGGEPLLHPRLTDFFEIARKYFKSTVIQLTTNGVLLARQPDSFWRACNKNKVYIEISDYPININVDVIRAKCKKHRACVGYTVCKDNAMYKITLDLEGRQSPETSFNTCGMGEGGGCVTLRDGRIYTCFVAAHIQFFNKYFGKDLHITDEDYIDIYKTNSNRGILDFLHKPFPFCRYCKPFASLDGLDWQVSMREISEWT